MVLWGLMQGVERYSELKRAIPNITEKMLTQQLRDLQRQGLITKEVHSDAPHKTSYHLTELGWSAKPIILALRDWGNGLQPVRSEVPVRSEAI